MVAPGLDRCPVAASTSRSSCSGIDRQAQAPQDQERGRPLGADGLQQWRVGAYLCGASCCRLVAGH
eukprot:3712284-Prymnesium_polylepis.1